MKVFVIVKKSGKPVKDAGMLFVFTKKKEAEDTGFEDKNEIVIPAELTLNPENEEPVEVPEEEE